MELIEKAREVFSREPQLIRHHAEDFFVVGDTHGDLDTTLEAIKFAEKEGLNLLFLGDYVDRGPRQLENIATLLELKLSWNGGLTLLRGNHESAEMNMWYGFYNAVVSIYEPQLYEKFAELFSQLPYAALIQDKVFCVHGGIPQKLTSIDEIEDFPKGEINPRHPKAIQLIWNDPCEDIDEFAPSWRGGGAMLFGRLAFERFMNMNNLKLMIRSHEPQDKGYGYLFNDRLLTVFSCRYYGIRPAGALLRGGKVEIVYLD
ncbi:MAG: metallophosphoesterase [Aigarchaeota archaeon]|nr:metallophosphoesterase [Aigarchaeota archaeon]MDW8021777.1 metallophosphoesterase [Nitrososphaerota archaeon]